MNHFMKKKKKKIKASKRLLSQALNCKLEL